MISSIPKHQKWISHLNSRLIDAMAIHLVDQNIKTPKLSSAGFFSGKIPPDNFGEDDFDTSIRVLKKEIPNHDTWVKSLDFFDEIALFLLTYHLGKTLICEAGFVIAGDPITKQKQFIVHENIFFDNVSLTPDLMINVLAQFLRANCSWRFLGVLVDDFEKNTVFEPQKTGLFFCDIFCRSSLMVLEF